MDSSTLLSEEVTTLRAELETLGEDIIRRLQSVQHTLHTSTPRALESVNGNHHDELQTLLRVSAQLASHKQAHAEELEQSEYLLNVLQTISNVADLTAKCQLAICALTDVTKSIVSDTDTVVNCTDLLTPCTLLDNLDKSLVLLPGPNTEIGSGKVCAQLRLIASNLRKRYSQYIRSCFSRRLCWHTSETAGCTVLLDAGKTNPFLWTDLWRAIISSRLLNELMHECVNMLWKCVLLPMWNSQAVPIGDDLESDEQEGPSLEPLPAVNITHDADSSATMTISIPACASHDRRVGITQCNKEGPCNSAQQQIRASIWAPEGGTRIYSQQVPMLITNTQTIISFLLNHAFPAEVEVELEQSSTDLGMRRTVTIQEIFWTAVTEPSQFLTRANHLVNSAPATSAHDQQYGLLHFLRRTIMDSLPSKGVQASSLAHVYVVSLLSPCAAFDEEFGANTLGATLRSLPELYASKCVQGALRTADMLARTPYGLTTTISLTVAAAASPDLVRGAASQLSLPEPFLVQLLQQHMFWTRSLANDTCNKQGFAGAPEASHTEAVVCSVQACLLVCVLHDLLHHATQSAQQASILVSSPPPLQSTFVLLNQLHTRHTTACLQAFALCASKFGRWLSDTHKHALERSPALSAVFYNDCQHLSQTCLKMSAMCHTSVLSVKVNAEELVGISSAATIAPRASVTAWQLLTDAIPSLQHLSNQALSMHWDRTDETTSKLLSLVNISPNHQRHSNRAADSARSFDPPENNSLIDKDSNSSVAQTLAQDFKNEPIQELTPAFGIFRLAEAVAKVGGLSQSIATQLHSNAAGPPRDTSHGAVTTATANNTSSKRSSGLIGSLATELAFGLGLDDSNRHALNSTPHMQLVIENIQYLAFQWHGVLAESVWARLIGTAVERVCRQCLQPILRTDTIDVTCGQGIGQILKQLQEMSFAFATTVIEREVSGVSVSSAPSFIRSVDRKDPTHKVLCVQCVPSWPRIAALRKFLECSLAEIAELLPLRTFSCFTVQEMRGLVMAVFDDSRKRAAVLDSMGGSA